MLLNAITNFFNQFENASPQPMFWLGFSGGLDSQVLLTLCAEYQKKNPISLKVIHIHHGLHSDADQWAQHCADTCQQYGLDFINQAIQFKLKPGESLEETARNHRYAAFASFMQAKDILLTAHHQDDQAETVLLQLFRGAGVKGLAAMPAISAFNNGFHARPLLNFPRIVLQQYAEKHQLKWINDSSNDDKRLTRNYLRQEILPKLKERWPSVTNLLARSAAHCAEAQELLESISETELFKLVGSKP